MRVAVLGAGWSGLAAARALSRAGLAFDGYERGDDVGGLWRGLYDGLRMNTSRDLTAFSDRPFHAGCPVYPTKEDVARYLRDYADAFGLRSHFRFGAEVTRVRPAWEVDGTPYDAVLVCTGHHSEPLWPELPGRFDGLKIHARDYRSPDVFAGKRVVVIGIGNSAVDIATAAAGRASSVVLAVRRGAHVLPKMLLGRPADAWAKTFRWLPRAVQSAGLQAFLRLRQGRMSDVGLPEPAHALHQAHPTLSDELLPLLREGRLRAKPAVVELLGDRVRFADGRVEPADVLVCATGYRPSFPFLDPAPDPASLYLQVVPTTLPSGLYFIGLVQPQQGPISRCAEAQASWVADLLRGRRGLPAPDEQRASIERAAAWRAELVDSPRHALEVDYYAYLRALSR
ncbi:MAG TPA: NAD(P)-binding domain-containing protein [Planctomycetota bacterium]|nr:NAD(P)-binding domain-containing protein [Planctomycetota bacterium]